MAGRSRHPSKEIEQAIRYDAEAAGWRFSKGRGHCFGYLRCPWNDETCRCGAFCQFSVWSTPRAPENHARQIRRLIDHCKYMQDDAGN
jgi:hypothetical protein